MMVSPMRHGLSRMSVQAVQSLGARSMKREVLLTYPHIDREGHLC